jgi:hypothetical protein
MSTSSGYKENNLMLRNKSVELVLIKERKYSQRFDEFQIIGTFPWCKLSEPSKHINILICTNCSDNLQYGKLHIYSKSSNRWLEIIIEICTLAYKIKNIKLKQYLFQPTVS